MRSAAIAGFVAIPDWFSFENQGANIAVGDVDGDGHLDLLVLMVDHPTPGPNRGLYRVGRKLDATGAVSGGWGPWIPVPDWFSFDNQGAGIAVADLDGDGSLDLVIFMIDNPLGVNRGVYRIGRKLDTNGLVTGGWTAWLDVPNWFSWENQGAAIAISQADTHGRRDLVVFAIDNPPETNRGIFQIGRRLDSKGVVNGGWTGWADVPDWFSWENQAAGIGLIDRPSGQRDLVVFQVDSPPGQNQAFFRFGANLDASGKVLGAWSPWFGVPGWFSWENQGGGIAVADLKAGGAHQLVTLLVDNPQGRNVGLVQTLSLEDDPELRGSWELLPYFSEVLPVHAALLHTGEVLFAAGSGNNGVRFNDKHFGDVKKGSFCSVVWDPARSVPASPRFFHPDTLRDATGKVLDFFCGGETFLADGRVISVGGTRAYDVDAHGNPQPGLGFEGRADSLAFDPVTRRWSSLSEMADGRWYPTPITLGDGRILVGSGLSKSGEPNRLVEVFSPDSSSGVWRRLPLPSKNVFSQLPLYAHLFLIGGGLILFSGGRMDDADISLPPCLIDITKTPIGILPLGGLEQVDSRNQSASVLLPPAQDQRVMILGGAPPRGEGNATDSVDVINLKALHQSPTFEPAASLLLPRVHANAVILPDRTVFVSGGALQREGGVTHRTTARLQSEIFDTLTGEWKLGATARIARMYHSVALLLQDGRVVAAGGNPEKGRQASWLPPDPNEELHLEVYSPPYLFRGQRPAIASAPAEWTYGSSIEIRSPAAGGIRWASLIKSSAATHSFNTSQRLVDLPIQAQGAGRLTIQVTEDRNIAPPGWYMLFLTNNDRVPSIAHWVKLS
jgi:hypothetical protein